ncbi:unnamed protein product [Lymnaea stagnalis]|uniref:Uncharacterized protein n=1 Tax=Lymnaea stagnalis TaxID=6523 RepID=A0AAV2IGD7_LYMST
MTRINIRMLLSVLGTLLLSQTATAQGPPLDVQDRPGFLLFPLSDPTTPQPAKPAPLDWSSFLSHMFDRSPLYGSAGNGAANKVPAPVVAAPQPSAPTTTTTTLPTTTSTATTTSPPTTTSTSTTTAKINDNRLLNEDGSVNRNRASLMVFATAKPVVADRQPTVNWLDKILNRQPLYNSNQYGVTEGTPTPSTKKPTLTGVYISNSGAVYIGRNPAAATTKPTVPGKVSQEPEPTDLDIHDKPFTGLPEDFFTNKNSSRLRRKRAVARDVANRTQQLGETSGGLSCLVPYQFPPCEYYNRCFHKLHDSCLPRESFLGDEAYRLCETVVEVVKTAESQTLRFYLNQVEECIKYELVNILESPTCDDVTTTISNALLSSNRSSCLYLHGKFCDVVADPPSRRDLALMFSKPTPDRDFMIRLLVNFGQMTSYCKGQGVNIFVTDLMQQVLSSNNTYKIPEPPVLSHS